MVLWFGHAESLFLYNKKQLEEVIGYMRPIQSFPKNVYVVKTALSYLYNLHSSRGKDYLIVTYDY